MSKQTAVEWLQHKISDLVSEYALTTLFEQAKAMEREQIEDAFQEGKWDWDNHLKNGMESKDLAEYYNETYKKDKNDTSI